MKRFHVHLGVDDLARSIRFYTGLFGAPPTVQKDDYAKWMVDEPRLNFAISARNGRVGVNHLGLQADTETELAEIRARFAAADAASLQDEPAANCCYVKSDKHWVSDPQGIAWEGYHTLSEIRYFDGNEASPAAASACCDAAGERQAASCCAPAVAVEAPASAASANVPATACCR